MNGSQHILQSIRRVGIIHDGCKPFRRVDGLQASCHTLESAQHHQHILGLLTQHHRSSIDSQEIAHIELADELHAHLVPVDVEVHPFEMTFYQASSEVAHRAR